MRKALQVKETTPGALAKFEAYLKAEGWYDWDVMSFDADKNIYEVDADHADFFIEQAESHGLELTPA